MATQSTIDVDKLRRFMRKRKAANASVVSLSDEFLELRNERKRLESSIRGKRSQPTPGEQAELDALDQQIQQIEEDRNAARNESDQWRFVSQLVDYAKRNGIRIDEQQCTAYAPVPGQAKRVEVS